MAIPTFMDFVDTRRRAGRSMHVQHGVNMPVSPADVIVNGFIARTFSPEDADRYFMHLLGTPPGQDLLRYHGMLLQRDRWYITCNSHFVRPSLRCVSTQNVLPLLDYHIGIGQGTVLPQRRWIPFDDFENGGPIEGCRLQLPVFFVNRGGGVGFSLPDILQRRDLDLYDANKMVPLVDRVKARLHVDWPDYRPWKCRIFRQDETYARNSISLSHFMRLVGKSVAKFFKECAPDRFTSITQWRIGTGGITQDHVKIIGVIHVSTHNWMPIIQLTHYVF
ncbi:hypothetical protein B0F90DRAFT_573981 [Multifurca ochricompacta]|uniref:Uncharacterized protein n=1 Tax=Multifurca ochricompacta TaxID=376703 RepID=A0AAD4M3K4_9AGAM|nr:hypothetical protein B0F90DRAFT_573981 [Multifurca ochricompacta]